MNLLKEANDTLLKEIKEPQGKVSLDLVFKI